MANKTEYEVDESINAIVKDYDTLKQMEVDGQLKPFSNYFIKDEDVNLSQLRTEVVYDRSSPDTSKNWGITVGIKGGIVTGSGDFTKYECIKVTAWNYDTTITYFIDLRNPTLKEITSGYPYSGCGQVLSPSNITEEHYSFSAVSSDKKKFYHYKAGYIKDSTDKARQDNDQYVVTKIEGYLKEPAMIYTGSELHEGNGIRIENGVISTAFKNLEFVGNYSATTAMLSVEIDLSNYNYLAFVSHGRGGQGDLGVFFGQGLTWTTKLGDSTMSKAFAYCYWGYSFSSALLISYNGSKTYVQKGDSAGSAFSYATGKPSYLTVSGSSGSAEQSYITLYRSKK